MEALGFAYIDIARRLTGKRAQLLRLFKKYNTGKTYLCEL